MQYSKTPSIMWYIISVFGFPGPCLSRYSLH